MLIDHTLFGTTDKVKLSIERIREYSQGEKIYCAFSGGKDSIVILKLLQLAGVKFDINYQFSTIDPPDLIYFIRSLKLDIIYHYPEKPFLTMLLKRGVPLRQQRWCCEQYREGGGKGRLVATGVRWEESPRRGKRMMFEYCKRYIGKRFLHPIIDWTHDEVWEFIDKYQLPYCNLYKKGWQRIGCLFCPMSSPHEKAMHVRFYPGYAKLFMTYFERLWQLQMSKGNKFAEKFTGGSSMFAWWISNQSAGKDSFQLNIFD